MCRMSQIFRYAIRQYSQNRAVLKQRSIMLMQESNSLINNTSNIPNIDASSNTDSLQLYKSLYPLVVRDSLIRNVDKELIDAIKRFDNVSYYIGPNREMYASPVLINAYKALLHKNVTDEKMHLAYILAWCFEMSTNALLLLDDLLDDQEIRWKKLCWHKKPEIGVKVALDIKLFHVSGFLLLKKYFKDHPSYMLLAHLLSDCMYKTSLGQHIDTELSGKFKLNPDINLVSMNTYLNLIKYKTSYVMYKSPILAAMYLNNTTDCKILSQFDAILDKLSKHFQSLNDMWDCFGKYSSFGRLGTDIKEGKCTWLSAKALECVNKEQLILFQKNYGKEELECQEVIKNIYKDIGMIDKFKQQKFEIMDDLQKYQESLSDPSLQNVIQYLIDTYLDIDEDLISN